MHVCTKLILLLAVTDTGGFRIKTKSSAVLSHTENVVRVSHVRK